MKTSKTPILHVRYLGMGVGGLDAGVELSS